MTIADHNLKMACLRIGDWELDPRRNVLARGDEESHLEPKVVEVLLYLALHPREVVSREDLFNAVWPGVIVGDDTLTQAVNKLRRSLGDDRRAPRYIETIAKRGYRLIAPVEPQMSPSPSIGLSPMHVPHLSWRKWAVLGSVAAAVALAVFAGLRGPDSTNGPATALPLVAVLPFANQTGDPGRDYFYDGVTEDIATALGRFSGLRVISRSSLAQYKDKPVNAEAIRESLGARYLVMGSIRESGGRLNVSVELSDTARGVVLWSERFAGAGADVFQIQDRIITTIVGRLAVKVTKQELGRATLKPVSSLEAYDLVLRARPLRSVDRAASRQARSMLARALQLAPDYAEAHVQLALAEVRQIEAGWVEHPVETLANAEKRLLTALAIDDPGANARARGALGVVHAMRGNFDQAAKEVERAVALNPSDAYALRSLGSTQLFLGQIDEAIATLEMAHRLDPASESAANDFGRALAYYSAARYADALAVTDLSIARFPRDGFLYALRAATLAQMGQAESARQAATRLLQVDPAFQLDSFGARFRDPRHAVHLQDGLRKAGL